MQPADFPSVPSVDDRAVEPETGKEMIDGQVQRVLPAYSPHADRQCDVAYVIRSNVAPGYVASTELLTRVDEASDFATDACIRKAGRDPDTGERYLEEVSFEIKHTQSDMDITKRARKLIRRGVRRVFAIHVKEDERGKVEAGPVQEWLAAEDRWRTLRPEDEIADPCLVQPVSVRALIDATSANDQVARALLAQDNPVLAAARREALEAQAEAHTRALEAQARELAEARQEAREAQARARELEAQVRQSLVDLCDVLDIKLTIERRARMDAMNSDELDALRTALRTRRRWPEE